MDPGKFTECWKDEERMNFLFSAFPANQSVNPHHWDTKLAFWTQLIQDMAMCHPYAYISWDNLFCRLTRKGKYPLGLQVVFDELIFKGDLVPTAEYTRDIHANESWVGWGLNWCVTKPVTWVADKVLSPIKSRPGRNLKCGQYVLLPALHQKCDEILQKLHDSLTQDKSHETSMHSMNIISYHDLQEMAENIVKDPESLDLVLATLRKDKKVQVIAIGGKVEKVEGKRRNEYSEGEKYIKFVKRSEKRVMPFTEAEIGIIHLIRARKILEDEIEKLGKEIDESTNSAKQLHKNGLKTKAVNALRKRKRLMIKVEKKEATLANVEQLLDNIHQCKTDKMVLETYRAGIAAYKDISKGLNESVIHDTMNDLSSVFDLHSDLSEAMATNLTGESEMDISELEAELSALTSSKNSDENDVSDLCDEFGSVNLNKENLDLPDVPIHHPITSNGLKTLPESPQKSSRILLKN